jgi:hypothetical protein
MEDVDGKESDRLQADIECLNPVSLRASLVSSVGNHCHVWRTSKRQRQECYDLTYTEFVIKQPLQGHEDFEIRLLFKQYRLLKERLEEIIPDALFSITRINGTRNVCVLAEAVNVWFNLANPQNEEEAVALLSQYVKPRIQLRRFVEFVRELQTSDNPRLIDLYGLDNLVLDKNHEIRYLDSFDVFFFEDMLDLVDGNDPELEHKIKLSRDRLDYLERVLLVAESQAG